MQGLNAAVESSDFTPYFTARGMAMDDDPAAMAQAYRLRFDVYCRDCDFLDAAEYPDQEERDEHDPSSLHALAFNLQGELVGYARLVMPDACGLFPWQSYCAELLPDITLPPPASSAEVSRLMVRRDYRRRRGDVVQGASVGLAEPAPDDFMERYRRRPQILLALYRQMYRHSCQNGIRYWYAAMERGLAGALVMMGFPFQRIGPQVDYFGPVAPYLADLRVLEQALALDAPELLAWFQEDPGAADIRTAAGNDPA